MYNSIIYIHFNQFQSLINRNNHVYHCLKYKTNKKRKTGQFREYTKMAMMNYAVKGFSSEFRVTSVNYKLGWRNFEEVGTKGLSTKQESTASSLSSAVVYFRSKALWFSGQRQTSACLINKLFLSVLPWLYVHYFFMPEPHRRRQWDLWKSA